jgi:hypothetical protein
MLRSTSEVDRSYSRQYAPTSQRTHCISVTKPELLNVFEEVTPVYTENHLRPINTVHMMQRFYILMQVGLISNIIVGRVIA